MRAKLLVAAVALTNLVLGVSLGWGLGQRAESAPTSSPAPEASLEVEAFESPAESPASTAPVTSGRRPRRGGGRRRGGHDPEGMVRHLKAQVGLDEAQVVAVREVLTASNTQVQALLESVRPRMHEIHSETQAKLRAILTPAQQEKLDALREEMERRGPPWRWKKGGPEGREGSERRGPEGRGPEGRGRGGREGHGRRGFGPGGPRPGGFGPEGEGSPPPRDDEHHRETPPPTGEEGPL